MWVYSNRLGNGTCKECGAFVSWVENLATGKKMPIDGHDIALRRMDTRTDHNGHNGGSRRGSACCPEAPEGTRGTHARIPLGDLSRR